jgi:heat shock protein HslJ
MNRYIVLLTGLLLLVLAACSPPPTPTAVPTLPPPVETSPETPAEETPSAEDETTETEETASEPAVEPTVPAVLSPEDEALASEIGLNPGQIMLDTQGLPYPWQANIVAGTPYDQSSPPGPVGLPAHIQVNFGTTDPTAVQVSDPIMYIIPVDAYKNLWDAAGNDTITNRVNDIYNLMVTNPFPAPTSSVPALPMERVVGTNDIAAQFAKPASINSTQTASKDGYRFFGRFAQSPNPVTNDSMNYVYQGFTNDGKYLVLFFYPPVGTSELPNTAADVSAEVMSEINTEPATHMSNTASTLNALPTSAWEPDLATLDALVKSLTIAGMPQSGIQGQAWQVVAESNNGQQTPIGNTDNLRVFFHSDGTVNVQADCNNATGTYDTQGGMIGQLAVNLGPITMAECGADSYSQTLLDTLSAAQDYRVQPGGQMLELIRPAGGGSLLFRLLGSADVAPPDTSQPPIDIPDAGQDEPYGRVIAPDGINLRSGPGTNYPIVGHAPFGEEGAIIGRSVDSQWWLAGDASNAVWVSATYVEAFNVENVPPVAAPPPPVPTAVPTPTPDPNPQISFNANPSVINQGDCTILSWDVENVRGVWVYPLGAPYTQYPVAGQGSRQECPSNTTTYEMRVLLNNGAIELRQVTITVNAASNPFVNTNWAVSSLYVNQINPPGTSQTLAFQGTNSVSGFDGCNNISGSYTLSGGSLTISASTATGASCPDTVDAQQAFLNALNETRSYQLSGSQLVLFNSAGQELMRLNRIN